MTPDPALPPAAAWLEDLYTQTDDARMVRALRTGPQSSAPGHMGGHTPVHRYEVAAPANDQRTVADPAPCQACGVDLGEDMTGHDVDDDTGDTLCLDRPIDVVCALCSPIAEDAGHDPVAWPCPAVGGRDAMVRAVSGDVADLRDQLDDARAERELYRDDRDRYRLAWASARRRARQARALLSGSVRSAPGRMGGAACVGDTRVLADTVAGLIADGVPPEQVADHGYPGVTAEGAHAAVEFAARYTERDTTGDETTTGHSYRDALADQLADHHHAIRYALQRVLAEWRDAQGIGESTAAGSLARALDWITGTPTPPRDHAAEVTTLALEVEDYRAATTRVEARQDHLDRRVDQLAHRVDDLETEVHRQPTCDSILTSSIGPVACELPHGHPGQHRQGTTQWTPAHLERATTADIAAVLTTAGIGETVARELASLLQQQFEIRQRPRPADAEDGES